MTRAAESGTSRISPTSTTTDSAMLAPTRRRALAGLVLVGRSLRITVDAMNAVPANIEAAEVNGAAVTVRHTAHMSARGGVLAGLP